jgi:hypothetical protein
MNILKLNDALVDLKAQRQLIEKAIDSMERLIRSYDPAEAKQRAPVRLAHPEGKNPQKTRDHGGIAEPKSGDAARRAK